ncbi:MAG: LytR C-terminal domain-containing protein [Candidatus Kapabacteria bacterium]|nr:LytR C-terminal domain-containing protein [Ignavibacteriota bacterium]MCW5883374.1 LytR C-terminal domain-containing protein [Candidatus Kapabacteria bacterium]
MKFKFDQKHLNYLIIGLLTILVTVMTTSFVLRIAVAPPVSASIDKTIAKSTAQEVIQLNILNACGAPGLASKAKDYLRARGFDVVEIGNSDEILSKTVIIDRLGDIQSARQLAYALGVRDSMITARIDSNLFLRATVMIGSDYNSLKPFSE